MAHSIWYFIMAHSVWVFLFQLSLFAFVPSQVQSIAPPHPEGVFEPGFLSPNRSGIHSNHNHTFGSWRTTRADDVRNLRRVQQQQQQKNRDLVVLNPSTGKIKVLVVMVYFSDHASRPRLSRDTYESMWMNSVKNWIHLNSRGNLEIEPVVVDWVVSDNTEEYYSYGKSGVATTLQEAFFPALDSLDARPGWDWSLFDTNQDGFIDSIVYAHSSFPAELGGSDCFGTDSNNRIWSHATTGSSIKWQSSDGTVKTNGYLVTSVYGQLCGTTVTGLGIPAHEFMHTFDVDDLYDLGNTNFGRAGIGAFGIMSYPYGGNNDQNFPGHLTAFSKIVTGWLQPVDIVCDGMYTLEPAETSSSSTFRISISDTEYFLLENRQAIEYDRDLFDSGLLIFHIDDMANGQTNAGYPGQAGWPANGNHYQVALMQADGNYDLEKNINIGDSADFFKAGDAFGPGGGGGDGGTVYPNSDAYQGGDIVETGIIVRVLLEQNQNVLIEVEGLGACSIEEQTGASPILSPSASPPPEPTNSVPTSGAPQSSSNIFVHQPTTPTTAAPTIHDGNIFAYPSDPPSTTTYSLTTITSHPSLPSVPTTTGIEPTPTSSPMIFPESEVLEGITMTSEATTTPYSSSVLGSITLLVVGWMIQRI